MEYNIFLDKILKKDNINIVILGNTLDQEKYAFKIKQELINYNIIPKCVDKEIKNINEINNEIDLLILCMNPNKEKLILDSCKLKINNVLIQPGAESEEIINFLVHNKIDYINGCILQYYKLFK